MGYKRKEPYVLTDGDAAIFQAAADNGDLFTEFYLDGWQFFDWQKRFHEASQKDITLIGGFGCGKTVGVALSAVVHATITPFFRFMNVAPEGKQAKFMYDEIVLKWQETLWWNRFVLESIKKPYPYLKIGYILPPHMSPTGRQQTVESEMFFYPIGDDATGIWSWQGDWINLDEGGMLHNLGEVMQNLGSRLRGSARWGRKYIRRLSVTTNPWDSDYLWWRYDKAEEKPDRYLSMTLHTMDNETYDEEDLEVITERITDGDLDRWLGGARPQPIGEHFSGAVIAANMIDSLDDVMTSYLDHENEAHLVEYQSIPLAGVTAWALPPDPDGSYVIIGDPGQGSVPKRNAPVIMVFDVTTFTDPVSDDDDFMGRAVLRAFWWGDGRGQYDPFVQKFREWKAKYRCIHATFDATGTQRGFDTIWSILEEEFVYGTDLSNRHKWRGLTILKRLMEETKFAFPPSIDGIRRQLGNYKTNDRNIAQDIVSVLIITALYLERVYYGYLGQEHVDEIEVAIEQTVDRYGRFHRTGHRFRGRSSL